MLYVAAAVVLALAHAAFVVFVVAGGLLVLRWPRAAWFHAPAAAWGVLIELGGWVCPLTPLENRLWVLAGRQGYGGGFIEHYVGRLLYPVGLTRATQIALGVAALAFNVAVYAWALRRARRGSGRGSAADRA